MSGISTIQSTIAADLDAYESAMWLTSSYLISMSSVSPLIGRLAMQFSPQVMILFSSAWFSIGAVVTSQARSFAAFVFGRVLVGIGGGGVMTLSLILVIQLTSKRTRGLMIGLTNAVGVLLVFDRFHGGLMMLTDDLGVHHWPHRGGCGVWGATSTDWMGMLCRHWKDSTQPCRRLADLI